MINNIHLNRPNEDIDNSNVYLTSVTLYTKISQLAYDDKAQNFIQHPSSLKVQCVWMTIVKV